LRKEETLKEKEKRLKNVEQFCVANIKFDTSEMAVKHIKKYHSTLDKALQCYHSLKISKVRSPKSFKIFGH
jgi:hypothetical protein